MKGCLNIAICGALLLLPGVLRAESGAEAWLRYAPPSEPERVKYGSLPASVALVGESTVLQSAQQELIRGIQAMLGTTLRKAEGQVGERSFLLGLTADIQRIEPEFSTSHELRTDGFWLTTARIHGFNCIIITGSRDRGVLYGVFAFLSRIARGENVLAPDVVEQPYAPIRWVDEWDNLDGRIERGYAGPSIFFEAGAVRRDLTRAGDYARLLASIGINGCTINNVNADPKVLEGSFLPQLARIADRFRPWGIRISISVNLSSPKVIGGLDTFDPLDPRVEDWWRKKIDDIYRLIPDFGGFVVKADSEGQLGPSTYGRTPVDAANVIARPLKSHGGIVFYRAFVYNHHLDWREPKNDRAKAAYDNFHPLDGKFDDNVIIQIKNGPIDFQVREPASPLFAGLRSTNQAIELQVTQEYLGQQRHLCFLAPMWKEVLDFDMRVDDGGTPVKDLVAGTVFHRALGGFVGVVNVGMDANWLGHPLAMANLYSFGRLAWNPNLGAGTIVDEWTRLTFGNDPLVVKTITEMQLASWQIYESYTGPLGAGTLTNITGSHYGPGVESSERNGWGQWHRADREGVGMDRSVRTGTGYSGQYPPAVAKIYESLATTPDELLLFFHHVPYTYKLQSGKTVIQHIYDSHYEGAERAQQLVQEWTQLEGHIDDERYTLTLARLEYQAGHAIVWRDAVSNWFLETSRIPDSRARVGHYPDRIEAESMRLNGYKSLKVAPKEVASGGRAAECAPSVTRCTAAFTFRGKAGAYDLAVEYFDQRTGASKFRVLVRDRVVDEWIADDHLPARAVGGDSSTRRWIKGVSLHSGDLVQIVGIPDGPERAALDYVEVHPSAPLAQPAIGDRAGPAKLTADEDHQRLMNLLDISKLRPGADGSHPEAPNAANYDESKANPYPTLPDPLLFNNGKRVKTSKDWTRRRAEIFEDFDREIYGRVPKDTPRVTWEVASTTREMNGEVPIVTKKLIGHVDNSSYPLIRVDIQLSLSTPADATGPVPVIMEFGLSPEVLAAIAKRLEQQNQQPAGSGPPVPTGPTWQQQVLARGWGYATIIPTTVQPDNGAGLSQGIIGLCNKGEPRKLDDWGALRAWAWGASRALDYLETDNSVDAKRVGLEGHSRYGKAALIAMAYDPRFAIAYISSSGEGGAKLNRRNWGEIVENLAGTGEYHWMAGKFLKYAGPLGWADLPVDSHELIALCAPRPLFISAGATKGDGWVDAKGMFMATVGAGPVYRLLGKKGLGTTEFPPIETTLIDGDLAFRQHSGGHTPGPNWPTFLTFASRYFDGPQVSSR
jgi:alpha-glucuronidase